MLKNLLFTSAVLLTAAGAQAASISVTEVDPDSSSTADVTVALASEVLSVTIGGLDVDTDGTNDSFTLTWALSSSLGTVAANSTTRFDPSLNIGGATLSAVFTGISGVGSLNGDSIVVDSLAIDRLDATQFQASQGDAWSATSGAFSSGITTANNIAVAGGGDGFVITHEGQPIGDQGNAFRFENFGFTVDVSTSGGGGNPNIPEPTSLALIGLGVAGVLVRRNRG